MLIPLYGFLKGDTMGLLILAQSTDTIATLARKLESAAQIRAAPRGKLQIRHQGKVLDPEVTVADSGLSQLERFDAQ